MQRKDWWYYTLVYARSISEHQSKQYGQLVKDVDCGSQKETYQVGPIEIVSFEEVWVVPLKIGSCHISIVRRFSTSKDYGENYGSYGENVCCWLRILAYHA